MSKKSLAIPATAAIGLLLTACSDPIVGDWELRYLNGERWPISGTDDGCTYRISIIFEIDDDLDTKYIAKTSDSCYGDYSYIFRGETEVEKPRKEYEISIFDEAFDEIFECKLEDDELKCDDLTYNDRYEFERK